MRKKSLHITEKQSEILGLLMSKSEAFRVFSVGENQSEIANELGITRQALNVHLRKLKSKGLIRTGRGFIDLTEKALTTLGVKTAEVFVTLRIDPGRRNNVYARIKELPIQKLYRVTGEIDLICTINQADIDDFLREASKIAGVRETTTYVVIETLK